MVIMEYIPDRGDIVWITLNPQAGHEQAGRRPALILTPKTYNQKVGLAILCPITSQIKGYPSRTGCGSFRPGKKSGLAHQESGICVQPGQNPTA
jgi:hypothetical protein